jgi:hypothetical protein
MCASACFFVFVGGIYKNTAFPSLSPILGIHRPYLASERLNELSGSQVLAASSLTRTALENYLKEMDVPTKYMNKMFSVPKDQILWISDEDFDADFANFIRSLRDRVEAKCKLTDVEEVALKSIQNKPYNKRTQAEWSIEERASRPGYSEHPRIQQGNGEVSGGSAQTPVNSTTPAIVETVHWHVLINCLKAGGYEPGAAPPAHNASRKIQVVSSVKVAGRGPGTPPCSQYNASRGDEKEEFIFFSWAEGFWTGYNIGGARPKMRRWLSFRH